MTNELAQKAWDLFLNIEEKGGYIAAFKEGYIQDEIEKLANERDMNIAMRKEILLGTNQYPNFDEEISKNINPDKIKTEFVKSDCLIAKPIRVYRGAEAFESLRLKTENSGKKPKVFMFTYGNMAMRKARSQFSSNFFACAGFEVVDNNGFATVEEGINASLEAKANIVVVCSSDQEYAEIVPEIFNKLNEKAIIVVAGYPKEIIDQLKEKGVKHFIHIKSNVLETLKSFQTELGL